MSNSPDITLEQRLEVAIKNTQALYLSDSLPWVIGYSGGKDSTATLQLVWKAISELPADKRTKPVHVISTDTLVENPVVAIWVENSLATIKIQAALQEIPIQAHRLTPRLENRFWVNLIGRGYPAPRPKFRWCTSRLKISASTEFITGMADQYGEAILVLGSRKAESNARDRVLAKYEHSTRDLLSRNSDSKLDRVWVYTPIALWTSDDVWEYLITHENPWGYDNHQLFHMYKGASPDAECPLVVDKSTPSCGDSRFGCFVCTMVAEDKSMQAMIQNDEEKRWMQPLLTFRNEYLVTAGDRSNREFTRIDGSLTLHRLDTNSTKSPPTPYKRMSVKEIENDKTTGKEIEVWRERNVTLVHGPYTQSRREELLLNLLKTQREIEDLLTKQRQLTSLGQLPNTDFEVIPLDEIEEIRRIWVHEKHEFEDSVPRLYEEALGRPYPFPELDESTPFRPEDIRLLRSVCEEMFPHSTADHLSPAYLQFRTLRNLLDVQHGYRSAIRRVGLIERLDKTLETTSFMCEDEALDFAIKKSHTMTPTMVDPQIDPFIRPLEEELVEEVSEGVGL